MIVLPRLDRFAAIELLAQYRDRGLEVISGAMPDLLPIVTYSPVGGRRVSNDELAALRTSILEIAHDHGMPGRISDVAVFDGRVARTLHSMLSMSAHEASHEEVWSYLTCCWLLDVAIWRFGEGADERRFIGNVNRNTFRRLWWRAEILGPSVDLTQFGEDELVNIMERPTIASDRRLARTIASEFLARVHEGAADSRMQLMREAMKRLLRLTPLVAFVGLSDGELRASVEMCFTMAAQGMSGGVAEQGGRHRLLPEFKPEAGKGLRPVVSPGVSVIDRITIPEAAAVSVAANIASPQFEVVVQKALAIARSAGRVTNTSLREMVSITAGEAREVLRALVDDGLLARRGVRRGTYYVLNDSSSTDTAWPPAAEISEDRAAIDRQQAAR